MASLAKDLIQIPQREHDGARAANRFAYQRSWALCHLLDLHSRGRDYVVLAEFHDDVAVLDSPTKPQSIEFVQVKSRKSGKQWTRGQLLQRKKDKTGGRHPSILGKLYGNYLAFANHAARLAFVTNVPCAMKRADKTKCEDHPSTCLDELVQSDRTEIKKRLTDEHSLGSFPGGENITHLEVCPLSISGHDEATLGKVTAFLHAQFAGTEVSPVALHKTLKSELERRSTRESPAKTVVELVSKHGISRAEFTQMLSAAVSASHARVPDRVEARLNSENVSLQEVLSIVAGARRFGVERLDPTNQLAQDAFEDATRLVFSGAANTLSETLTLLQPSVGSSLARIEELHGTSYRKAIIAVAVIENAGNNPLSPPDPKGQDQGS